MEKYFSINEKGLSVRCKLYCDNIKTIQKAVIFAHGFGGHKDNRYAQTLAERIQKRHKEVALIVFNFPCHGDDARNKLLLEDCLSYVELVVDYAKRKYNAEAVYGCGTSFGAYVFLKYIAERENPFEKLVLRCPAVNMYDILTNVIMELGSVRLLKKGKPIMVGFDRKVKVTKEFVTDLEQSDITKYDYQQYAQNILIIQGTKDNVVSFEQVKAFAEKNGCVFEEVQGADHTFSDPKRTKTAINCTMNFLF